jgi:hypothetical protein
LKQKGSEIMTHSIDQPDVFYTQLLSFAREAFEAEQYEVSYHILAALSHHAIGSTERLQEIQAEIAKQKQYIDRDRQEHPLSSKSANEHGHNNIFNSLDSQIRSHLLIAKSQKQIDRLESQ